MKRTLAAIALACLTSSSAFAVDEAALKTYATKALSKCPNPVVTLEAVPRGGPANFNIYTVALTSSDEYCNTKKFLAYSPKTQQVIIGGILALPQDGRPAAERVRAHVSEALKKPMAISIAPFPMPDGLKMVTMKRDTEYGVLNYHALLDQSEQFLLIGLRGNLSSDPAKLLTDSLGVDAAVRRGNPKAKATVLELSDFECPSCARAHKRLDPWISKNLDSIHYMRLDLPLFESHKWSMDAAMGARAISKVQPKKYWEYVDYVFANQEQIGARPSFDAVLKDFAEDHDINWGAIESVYRSKSERQAMLDQVGRAFDAGIYGTPTFILNGQILGYGDGTFPAKAIQTAGGIKTGLPPEAKPAVKAPAKAPVKPAAKKP